MAGYEGKCANLHGHRWRVLVEIKGEQLEKSGQIRGMLLDFGQVKEEVKKMTDFFDHSFIYETGSLKSKTIEALEEEKFRMIPVSFRPTAENFAKHFYEEMEKRNYRFLK